MKLLYLANIRMPTEKAHGLQIMQNCEAFAQHGNTVTLMTTRRVNTPEMSKISDPFAYYGVEKRFTIERVPCLDLFPLGHRFERIAFPIQTLSYVLVLALILIFRRADVYYSRDALTLLALSLFKPRHALVFEAHQLAKSGTGKRLQTWCVRRVGLVVAVTGKLAADLRERGAASSITAHDGFRIERFANLSERKVARAQLGLPVDAFICGYVGQLHTMSMSKGVDTLINAIAKIGNTPVSVCLVGGPQEMLEQLRTRWRELGLPEDRFLAPGRVEPSKVPLYIRTFDVCTMTFPWTEHFAYYASPLKLFEYMAAGGVALCSDLPAVAEVIRDGETGVLVPVGDEQAIAAAIQRLYTDPQLRERIGKQAQEEAAHYSWYARAETILERIEEIKAEVH
ncbi:MAG: glycosyltransferase family 4 protein [Anaerolineae bacterium]